MSKYEYASVLTEDGKIVQGVVVDETEKSNTGEGVALGAVLGLLTGDPTGLVVGSILGAVVGSGISASKNATVLGDNGEKVTGEVIKGSRGIIETES